MTSPGGQGSKRARGRVRLMVLLEGRVIGGVHQDSNGTLRFTYEDEWRENPDAYPLSLSMPLTASEHPHAVISAFLWGLLPDNARTLDHYGRLFGVSAGNPVALLSHIGADCAGAVQFTPPERLQQLLGTARDASDVEWLTETAVARELRSVREHGVPGSNRRTVGQFSLAGAQPKIALLEEDGRWGRPGGRTPTNRILKPPSRDFEGFAENEHFCLDLTAELGLGAVRSRVLRFEDEVAIVVDRFDRQQHGRSRYRVHQEDICQALAVMPTRKYENEGGPGVAATISLLREASDRPDEDVDRFIGITAVNWIVAATDSHAKNFALLHARGRSTRLAPFYDIASYLPYASSRLHQVKLAMKIGGEYRVRRISRVSWEALARENGLTPDAVLAHVAALLSMLPEAVQRVRARAVNEGLNQTIIDDLADRILARIEDCNARAA